MALFGPAQGQWQVLVDNANTDGSWGNGSSGDADNSGGTIAFDPKLYDTDAFNAAYDSSTGTPAPMNFGGPDYSYGSEGNPFSYDTSGDYYGGSSPYDMSFGNPDMGSYTLSSSDAGALYGNTGYGGDNAYAGNDLLRKYKDAVSPFQGLLKNPIISALMSLNPATAILKTALGGPNSVGGFLGSLFGSSPIGKIAGALGGSQLANYATEGQFAPMTSQGLGSMFGSLAGGMSGIPFGAAAGNYLGGQAGSLIPNSFAPGETGGVPNNMSMGGMPTSLGMGGVGNILGTDNNSGIGGLVGLGLGLNANRVANNQIKSLEGLYGQNSSYAQALRQQLERRDAAAGRRSQYGPREVELQAQLAGNAAKLQPGLQALYAQRTGLQNRMAANVLNNLSRNPNIFQGLSGLSGLFGGGSENPAWSGGGFQSGNEGMGD